MGGTWYRSSADRKDWVQKRKEPRKTVELLALLRAVDGGAPLGNCKVLDISERGARLTLDCPSDVPEHFFLVLYGRAFRRCQVKWRSATEVGVQFSRA